jgi:chemotaxis signal transduction protein
LDVVIFTLQTEAGPRRCAVETGVVEEVIPLGVVTPVPSAPPAVAGAMNVRGQVCPVLQLGEVLRASRSAGDSSPRAGHPCLLISAGENRVVLCVGHIEEVARVTGGLLTSAGRDMLVSGILDSHRGPLRLVDAERVVDRVAREVERLAAGVMGERPAPDHRDGATT